VSRRKRTRIRRKKISEMTEITNTHLQKKFELHITLSNKVEIQGWKSSSIHGDPLLGPALKHYLTTYAGTKEEAEDKLKDGLQVLYLMDKKHEIIRAKIEYIVFDAIFKENR